MGAEPTVTLPVYRGSTSSDLAAELRARLADARLATTRREIGLCSAETPRIVSELLGRAGVVRWLVRCTYLSIGLGPCDLDDIPEPARQAAMALGFSPLIWMLHGPLLPLRTPNFIGPEGFVKLEVYGGARIYLFTYLDDGTEVETAPGRMLNIRSEGLQGSGDLERDYAVHLERVLALIQERGCRPIYRSTPEALKAAWRLYPAFFTPVKIHVAMVLMLLGPALLLLLLLLRQL